MNEEEQFNQAFGDHTGIHEDCRDDIDNIKDNNDDVSKFELISSDAGRFTDLAWELLGRYIANNNRLTEIGMPRRMSPHR